MRHGRATAGLCMVATLVLLAGAVVATADQAAIERLRQDREAARWALRLAREAVAATVSHTEAPEPPGEAPKALRAKAGVFVSLSVDGKKRGCRGFLRPTAPTLVEQIVASASAAASRDDRQSALTREELPRLAIHVAIAGEPRRLRAGAVPDPAREGVLAEGPNGHGVILPGEARTGAWAVAEARRRAGLRSEDKGVMWRFDCVVFRDRPRSAG